MSSADAAAMPALLPGAGNPYLAQSKYYARLVLSVTWVEIVLVLGMFTCQTITNWKYTKRFWSDYWVALFTLVLGLVGQGMLNYSVKTGLDFGRTLDIGSLQMSLKWGWIAVLISIVGATTGKISIICFLNQVRGRHRNKRPWFLYFIAVSNIIIDIVAMTLLITECSPVSKLWNFTEPGMCHSSTVIQDFAYLQSTYSAISDIALALYPISIVRKLQMELRVKVSLCVLMGFGILAAACACIKASQLYCLDNTAGIRYEVAPMIVAAMTEQWITLLVACLPPSRPVLKAILQRGRTATNDLKSRVSPEKDTSKHHSFMDIFGRNIDSPVGCTSQAYHGERRDPRNLESSLSHRRGKSDLPHEDTIQGIVMRTEITIEFEDDDEVTVRGSSDDGKSGKSEFCGARSEDGSEKTVHEEV